MKVTSLSPFRARVAGAGATGALFAAASILVFVVDISTLRPFLPAIRMLVIGAWELRLWSSED